MSDPNRSKNSGLTSQIEIIRDDPRPTEEMIAPPFDENANPLYMLAQLVEKLENLEDWPHSAKSDDERGDSYSDSHQARGYLREVDHYLNLFQKQSQILRKLLTKLN
jgi:hypothetical protein